MITITMAFTYNVTFGKLEIPIPIQIPTAIGITKSMIFLSIP
jgi:hypothetical protein